MIADIIFLAIVALSWVILRSSMHQARENQQTYEKFIEEGRQRRIDALYGRDPNQE